MPNSPFPILGTSVPPLLGRTALLQIVLNALTKAAPDHLQVVGPRFAGKTVLLHGLAGQLQASGGHLYAAVFIWDLGHQTPATDHQFMERLAQELGAALKRTHPDCAELLASAKETAYQDISEVLDLLSEEGKKVLAIMDGFEKPLSQPNLTRNLWDRLRELALKPSLRLVTASRHTLGDLLRNPDAETSEFWNIFNQAPVRVACFDEADMASAISKMVGIQMERGARTELLNATNGFPVLVLAVLNAVYDRVGSGTVSAEAVCAACDDGFDSLRDTLGALWKDCTFSSQDLLRRVLDEAGVSRAGIAAADANMLVERGFVHATGARLERPSRLMRRYLEEQPNEGNALVRLFGTADAYQRNLKGVFERRLASLTGLDATLKRYLEGGVRDLPEHPDVFMSHIRGIVDKAFDLIWRAEIPDKRIPSEWMAVWKRNDERGIERWETTFPQGIHRVRLLNCMTGTDKSAPCAAHVTKATYVLMNAVHGFGDFGQHQEGAPVDAGAAYAAFHLCVELAASLLRELPRAH